MDFMFIALAALFAGVVNAAAGGGTFVTFPTLNYFGSLGQKFASTTSAVGLLPGSAAPILKVWHDVKVLPAGIMFVCAVASFLGGAVGAFLLLATPDEMFRLLVPWLLLFSTILFIASKSISRWVGRERGRDSIGATLLVGVLQFFIAIYGGYFGAGAGVLILAGLSFASMREIRHMNALKVFLSTLVQAVAAAVFIYAQKVDWHFAAVMAVASAVGGFWGMAIARIANRNSLRIAVIVIGVAVTGLYFAHNYFHAFGDDTFQPMPDDSLPATP